MQGKGGKQARQATEPEQAFNAMSSSRRPSRHLTCRPSDARVGALLFLRRRRADAAASAAAAVDAGASLAEAGSEALALRPSAALANALPPPPSAAPTPPSPPRLRLRLPPARSDSCEARDEALVREPARSEPLLPPPPPRLRMLTAAAAKGGHAGGKGRQGKGRHTTWGRVGRQRGGGGEAQIASSPSGVNRSKHPDSPSPAPGSHPQSASCAARGCC